jgi:hypothetical protein
MQKVRRGYVFRARLLQQESTGFQGWVARTFIHGKMTGNAYARLEYRAASVRSQQNIRALRGPRGIESVSRMIIDRSGQAGSRGAGGVNVFFLNVESWGNAQHARRAWEKERDGGDNDNGFGTKFPGQLHKFCFHGCL